MKTVNLTVNGRPLTADIEPRTHLADFLRETQNLTGTHIGCEHGVCGACTILVDGMPARSCITYAAACENSEIVTIEGLDDDEIAAELRAAFSREHALQCGYCTPGMIVSARDLVLRMETQTEHEIRVAMSGNLCRCTGYAGIIRAIQSVIADRRMRGIAAVPDGGRRRMGPAGSGSAGPEMNGRSPEARAGSGGRLLPQSRAATPWTATRHDGAWMPQAGFTQSFTVSHPPETVWEFFGRIGEVAACLPGASLAGEPEDGHVEGQIKVKVGPISAAFQGVAELSRDDAARTGTITGSGKDARSNSSTRGMITYAVVPGEQPGQTRVEIDVGYTLTGMLAQFGRSGLVQDVAGRLTAAFAQNLEARLAGDPAGSAGTLPASELDAGSLVSTVLLGRVKQFFARMFRRG